MSGFSRGFTSVLQHAGFTKEAASKLRKMFDLRLDDARKGPLPGQDWYAAFLGDKPIGHMRMNGSGRLLESLITDPKYMGLGLGNKMYGEVARRQPGGIMRSDSTVSDAATRGYLSRANRPDLEVHTNLTARRGPKSVSGNPYGTGLYTTDKTPVFEMHMPKAAIIKDKPAPPSKVQLKNRKKEEVNETLQEINHQFSNAWNERLPTWSPALFRRTPPPSPHQMQLAPPPPRPRDHLATPLEERLDAFRRQKHGLPEPPKPDHGQAAYDALMALERKRYNL